MEDITLNEKEEQNLPKSQVSEVVEQDGSAVEKSPQNHSGSGKS